MYYIIKALVELYHVRCLNSLKIDKYYGLKEKKMDEINGE